jgi:hypothetical protein
MLIRLNLSGIFTTDIEVAVLPVRGNLLCYHGAHPKTGKVIEAEGLVEKVIYLLGSEQPAPVAIVIVMARPISGF